MKTRPIPEVLPLPLESDQVEMLAFFHDAIHELVCYGTHILAWALQKNKHKEGLNEVSIASHLLFRHILELLDSISVQMKVGVVVPCKLQLRGILEAYLGLAYMLELDEKREERAACFFIVDHYKKLNSSRKYIPGTNENKEFIELMKDDVLYKAGVFDNFNGAQEAEIAQSRIDLPHYDLVREEYLRYTKNNTKKLDSIKWYMLYDGEDSLFLLAKRLKKSSLYDTLYKSWSDAVHGTNLFSGALSKGNDDDNGNFNQIRMILESNRVTELTIVLGMDIYMLMIQKFAPREILNLARWAQRFDQAYMRKIKRITIKESDTAIQQNS